MEKKRRAVSMFKDGFSCSQAVLAAFGPEFGLSGETALRISQGFGAGMARLAETCGALTGAIMVIGLKHGRTRLEDDAAKEKTYALVRELFAKFRARHGALRCQDLLGCHIGTPEGLKIFKEKKGHDTICPRFIETAAEILEDILEAR